MSQTVAGTLVDVLETIGVTHMFGLIGNSLDPIADAVRHSNIGWIGVRHGEGAALVAAGQPKLTGPLGICCGTTGPDYFHATDANPLFRDVSLHTEIRADTGR